MAGGPADPAMLERLLNGELGGNFTGIGNMTASFMADVTGFYHAVDWSERWLLGLAAFHVLVWTIAVGFRHYDNVQIVLLLAVLGVIYCAETINRIAGENWRSFATQNYFDKRGVFISVMFSTPLLACSMFVLLNALRSASSLLIAVKRKELKAEMRRKKKLEGKKLKASGAGGGEKED